jgi:hypothetical protein
LKGKIRRKSEVVEREREREREKQGMGIERFVEEEGTRLEVSFFVYTSEYIYIYIYIYVCREDGN